jgi:hypothetical protein
VPGRYVGVGLIRLIGTARMVLPLGHDASNFPLSPKPF